MRPFLHDRLQRWHALLLTCNAALAKLSRRDLDLESSVRRFLSEAVAAQKALQRPVAENRLLGLEAQYVTALGGVHPLTLEKVATARRAMQRSIALHVLMHGGELVRTDAERDRQTLDQGRADLQSIVLAAHELGLVEAQPGGVWSQPSLDHLWRRLRDAPQTAPAARAVQLQLNTSDVLLLLGDLVTEAAA